MWCEGGASKAKAPVEHHGGDNGLLCCCVLSSNSHVPIFKTAHVLDKLCNINEGQIDLPFLSGFFEDNGIL